MVTKQNELGGRRGGTVYALYDGYDLYEIHDAVANGFGHSSEYKSFVVKDLWMNREEEMENIMSHLSKRSGNVSTVIGDDVIRAILDANIRGVHVEIFYFDEKSKSLHSLALDTYNKIKFAREIISDKDRNKINKIASRYGFIL